MSEPRGLLHRLDNGLRVVCIAQPHLHACEVSCYIGAGSRHEAPERAGISHFLEHMLFRGTTDYPTSFELEIAFERLGGSANAATDAETTCYFSRFPPEHAEDGLALFASMLQRPLLNDIDIERRIILEEAQEDFSESGELINPDTIMADLIWSGTPLAQPTIGTPETLAAIDGAALSEHFSRYYSPRNCVVAVAGRVDPERVFAAAERTFGGWSGPERETVAPVRPMLHGRREAWVRDSASQVMVQLAFPLPGRDSGHALNLRILRRILSGGVTSRLMMRLRETLGLTYSVEASLTLLEETGALVVDFQVIPENLVESIRETLAVFETLLSEPVPADEFERVIRSYRFDLDFSRDMPDEMVSRYGWGEMVGYLREIGAEREAVETCTIPGLTDSIRACIDPRQVRLAVVGPFRKTDRRPIGACLDRFAALVS